MVESRQLEKGACAVIAAFLLIAALFLGGCSSGPTVGSSSSDDYSIAEYNADIDNLSRILSRAQSLYNTLEATNTSAFTSQSQVDRYNAMVDEYNELAEKYKEAVREFNRKYAENAEGDGNRQTDPNNIQLPPKK